MILKLPVFVNEAQMSVCQKILLISGQICLHKSTPSNHPKPKKPKYTLALNQCGESTLLPPESGFCFNALGGAFLSVHQQAQMEQTYKNTFL